MGTFDDLFVSASLVLTGAFLAVGMSFFGPYWLSNISPTYASELAWTNKSDYISDPSDISLYPDRGLWAQCGKQCHWFWSDNYRLQYNLLTPLKWHLAAQVLYFIAATVILFCEIFARVQMCCRPRSGVFISLGISLMFSALLQLATVATFGGGASRSPYNAISNPTVFTQYLGKVDVTLLIPYLGWCYWMAVVGTMLTVLAGVLFLLTACWQKKF